MRLGALFEGETGGEGDNRRRPGLRGSAAAKAGADWSKDRGGVHGPIASEMEVADVANTRALAKLIAGAVGKA